MAEEKKVALRHATYNLTNLQDVKLVANKLQKFLDENSLIVNIKGKNYAMVEAWQFTGGMFGLSPNVVEIKDLSSEKEKKYLAKVEITNLKTKQVVANGFAVCSSLESAKVKAGFEEYAVLSMAQTRAIGKAYRNLIGWVMKMAGYEATPAEEMKADKKDEKIVPPVKNPKPTIEMTLSGIRTSKDKVQLNKVKTSIISGTGYNDVQKRLLTNAIEDRLKELQ